MHSSASTAIAVKRAQAVASECIARVAACIRMHRVALGLARRGALQRTHAIAVAGAAVGKRRCHTAALFNTAALQDRLAVNQKRYKELETQLSNVSSMSPKEMAKLSKEFSTLAALQTLVEEHAEAASALKSTQEVIAEEQARSKPDQEIIELAESEQAELTKRKLELEQSIVRQLVPRDEADDRGVVVEVRAGAGGDEASLFAGDMFDMYCNFAMLRGWQTELLSVAKSEFGGMKEAAMAIRGEEVFKWLKFESGVHRVQRVPVNDVRIHTSTMSVVVMPEPEETDVELRPDDVKVDVYRSGGAGGQHVNTTNSAVRLTHIPTGIVVAIQDERSQHQNRAKAERILRTKLYELARMQQEKEMAQARSVIGSGDRSERIRTYNFPQDRVTDHRIGYTVQGVERLLTGEALGQMIERLQAQELEDRVARLFAQSSSESKK